MEPPPKRFVTVSNDDVDKIIADRTPQSSIATTNNWMKVAEAYRDENFSGLSFDSCTKDELCNFLASLYVGVRRADKQPYQRNSLLGLRGALHRHMRESRGFDIINSSDFHRANAALDGKLKQMKRDGDLKPVQHKEVITDDDMEKIKYYFLRSKSAEDLNLWVWFSITLHLSLRGRELQRKLTKNDLIKKTDENGRSYYELNADFATKNHPGGVNDKHSPGNAGRIQDPDQVLSIDLLLSSLNPAREELFQRPKPDKSIKAGEKVWYENAPMGKNSLGNMMARISEVCKLSKKYTNHSVRATAVSRLQRSGLSDRAIMSVTGHKSAASLQAYAVPSDN